MKLRLAFGLVSSAAFLVVACGPSSTSGGIASDAGPTADVQIPATGPIPEDAAPAAVAKAICDKVAQCACDLSTAAPCMQDSVCDTSTCVASFTMLYQSADTAALSTGRVYDPQGARTCVEAVAAADCRDDDYHNLCTVLWKGTQAIGQPCGPTQACASTSVAPADCAGDGVCAAIPSGPPMGPPMGAACSGECVGSTCSVTIGRGASGGQCQHDDGLACIGGTCQPLLAQGTSCMGAGECADPLACIGGMCAARQPDGSACDVTSIIDQPCVAGSGCVGGVCATLKANGQTCAGSAECLENNCVTGQCVREFADPICGG